MTAFVVLWFPLFVLRLSPAALDHVIRISETADFLEFDQGALVRPVIEEILASAVDLKLLGLCLALFADLNKLSRNRIAVLGALGNCLLVQELRLICCSQHRLAV